MAKRTFVTKSAKDIKPRVTAFIYGFPGSGKTYLARTLLDSESLYPALIVVCDAGDMTIKDLVNEDTFVVAPGTFENLTAIYAELSGKNNGGFKTVFIDNLTELHRTALLERAKLSSANKPRSEYEFTQNDYGIARNQILAVISAFATKLPGINVFATAIAVPSIDERTGRQMVLPDLAGKLGVEVPGYFDLVAYLDTEAPKPRDVRAAQKAGTKPPGVERILRVNQTPNAPVARNRGGVFDSDIYDPSLRDIYTAMTE